MMMMMMMMMMKSVSLASHSNTDSYSRNASKHRQSCSRCQKTACADRHTNVGTMTHINGTMTHINGTMTHRNGTMTHINGTMTNINVVHLTTILASELSAQIKENMGFKHLFRQCGGKPVTRLGEQMNFTCTFVSKLRRHTGVSGQQVSGVYNGKEQNAQKIRIRNETG